MDHGFKEGDINAEGAVSYCRIEAGTDEASDEGERAEEKSIQEQFRWETLALTWRVWVGCGGWDGALIPRPLSVDAPSPVASCLCISDKHPGWRI
mgnify:CR=1 FL=1